MHAKNCLFEFKFSEGMSMIKVLGFSQGSLDTNYSILLTIIEGIRNCVPLGLGWWRNQGQPSTSMRGIITLIAV